MDKLKKLVDSIIGLLFISYIIAYLVSPNTNLPTLYEWKVTVTEPLINIIEFLKNLIH